MCPWQQFNKTVVEIDVRIQVDQRKKAVCDASATPNKTSTCSFCPEYILEVLSSPHRPWNENVDSTS